MSAGPGVPRTAGGPSAGDLHRPDAAAVRPATLDEGAEGVDSLGADQQLVLGALAIGWSGKSRNWVMVFLTELDATDAKGRRFTGEGIQLLIRGLAQAGWLVDVPQRIGFWQVAPARRSAVFLDTIDRHGLAPLRDALASVSRFDDSVPNSWTHFVDLESAAAIVRLETFGGVPFEKVSRMRDYCRLRPRLDRCRAGGHRLGARRPLVRPARTRHANGHPGAIARTSDGRMEGTADRSHRSGTSADCPATGCRAHRHAAAGIGRVHVCGRNTRSNCPSCCNR